MRVVRVCCPHALSTCVARACRVCVVALVSVAHPCGPWLLPVLAVCDCPPHGLRARVDFVCVAGGCRLRILCAHVVRHCSCVCCLWLMLWLWLLLWCVFGVRAFCPCVLCVIVVCVCVVCATVAPLFCVVVWCGDRGCVWLCVSTCACVYLFALVCDCPVLGCAQWCLCM